MITEDYVSFETAKLLKEKGFDEPIEMLIREDGTRYHADTNSVTRKRHIMLRNSEINMYSTDISCPTLQMAMKWLRKEHKRCIVSIPVVTDDDGDGGCLWNYVISRKLYPLYKSERLYESQETALNDAIKYCLENLI